MSDMSERNDIDALVWARLSAVAGGEPDLSGAHAQVRRRVSRARRRRAAAITGSAGVSVLLLGTVYAMNTGDTRGRLTSAEAPTTIARPQDDVSIGVSTTSPAIDSSVVSTTPDTGIASTATSSPDGPSSSATNTDDQAGSTLAPGDDGDDGDRDELFDVVVAATETRTLSGVGGAVDVRVEAGALSFASYPVAAAGFTAAVTKGDPDELEVTFTSSTHRTRLRVRIDGTRLRADRSEESRPTSSTATTTANTTASTISGGGPDTTDDDTDDDVDHDGGSGSGSGGDGSGGDGSGGSRGGSGSGGGERSDDGGTSGGSGSPDGSDG